MGKLQEFLMQSEERAQVMEEVAISGFPVPFTVKSITEGENKALRKTCQKVNFDKKTHQKTTETDMDLYNNRLVIACCVDPNFKDADLQAKYGVMGAEALIDVLLKPGQFVDLLVAIQDVNGFLWYWGFGWLSGGTICGYRDGNCSLWPDWVFFML